MYKNQLQELAQRSCFNLPSYSCIREGPDHAPRFKATVNFNGETFESPQYCSTLRQAEHSAAEVALNALAGRGPSNSLAARVLSDYNKPKRATELSMEILLARISIRCCFDLPSYTCIKEGPDHAPRFKAMVSFNGETFVSPNFCSTQRKAEQSAAEIALKSVVARGPPNSLATKILDETGVYKNLLQEVSQRVGASLPAYSTFRSGLGHLPVFTCTVELARIIFTGEPAKNKKQAEKNAAMAAWTSLKLLAQQYEISNPGRARNDEQEHVTVARALQRYLVQARINKVAFPIKFQTQNPRPPSIQQAPPASSKILPFICPRPNRSRPFVVSSANTSSVSSKICPQSRPNNTAGNETTMSARTSQDQKSTVTLDDSLLSLVDNIRIRPQKFPAAGAAPYIPIRHFNPHHRFAPPVTIRNAIPVFSSPPPRAASLSPRVMRPTTAGIAPPVFVRQPTPVLAPPVCLDQLPLLDSTIKVAEPPYSKAPLTKSDEPLASKAADAPSETPPVAVSMSGIVDAPPALKAPPVLPEGSFSNDPPTSKDLPNPVEPSAPTVCVVPPSSSATT